MNTWLKCTKYKENKIQKLTLEEVENLDGFLNTKEMESVVKNLLLMKTPA